MQAELYSFSRRGAKLSLRIKEYLSGLGYESQAGTLPKYADPAIVLVAMEDYHTNCQAAFTKCETLIFVGAAGIAVRTIAPYLKSKATDPAVICIDECGQFVIPLVSGHIGGANILARKIAEHLGAVPVITTATDVNELFAVDEWAIRNGLIIDDLKAAKDFAAALVDGQKVGLRTDLEIRGSLPTNVILGEQPETGMIVTTKQGIKPFAKSLVLIPQIVYLGIGCKRDTKMETIERLVLPLLEQAGYDWRSIAAIASIDLKKDEVGLLNFANKYQWTAKFYTAAELIGVQGQFTKSAFVQSVAGVDNVCERAAVLASGNGILKLRKTSLDGVTLAIAESNFILEF